MSFFIVARLNVGCSRAISMVLTALFLVAGLATAGAASPRIHRDLQVLYTFEAGEGDVVRDRSGVGQALDLKIGDSSAVQWSDGTLNIKAATIIASDGPAKKVIDAVKRSNAISVEAWVKPHDAKQNGPARLVTLSENSNHRNFTVGQDANTYDFRLRTSSTSSNGLPSAALPKDTARTSLTHLVYTRDAKGRIEIFVDGKSRKTDTADGNMSGWDDSFRFALANELNNSRPWLGELHLVAVYSTALSHKEVVQNYWAGPAGTTAQQLASTTSSRVTDELQTLYTFESGKGDIVRDRSGVGKPLDLKIGKSSAAQWSDGSLKIKAATIIASDAPAKKVIDAIKRSNAVSVEVWATPHDTQQAGPARLVTLSSNSSNRNFTAGQDGNTYDFRLRTSSTSHNGLPSTALPTSTARTSLTHIVYARDSKGGVKVFVDGKPRMSTKIDGDMNGWDNGFRLALGNEFDNRRPWLGDLHLVAIYSRALSASDVQKNFQAGPDGQSQTTPAVAVDHSSQLFERKVAGLLANHCLECHDTVTREGGLDLSRREVAFKGGDSGTPIVSGKADESLMWQYVDSDEMPLDRPPLSKDQKKLLKEWLDSGAKWPIEVIDPVVYVYDDLTADNWIRRLTVPEYIETVRSAVGVDISAEARELLPKDLRADGFSNTAYNLTVDLKHVESYAELATIISRRMDIEAFVSQFTKDRTLNTDNSTRKIVSAIGKWMFRGPLSAREEQNYSGIATSVASASGTFDEGMRYMVEAMLQSPRFVYRLEDQRGYGTMPVRGFELASRLSYITWGGPPDKALLKAAEASELSSDSQLRSQVERMLKDPRAIKQSERFITEWLNLNRLDNLQPNAERFPTWSPELAQDMKAETLAYFRHVVWDENRPLSDLLNAQSTFATPRLAKHYGLEPKGKTLARYDVENVKSRGGLLTQGSLLTMGGDDASMVTRGLFVLHELLRGVVKAPPPCVDTNPPPTKSGVSQRTIAETRLVNANCSGCHVRFEPLAFGLEKFNGIGFYSDKDEHGNKLREDGAILFPGSAKPVNFDTSAQLMDALAKSDRVRESITWKIAQFAIGRPLGAADASILEAVHKEAMANGGTWSSTLTAIIMSDLVRTTRVQDTE